MFTGSNGTRKGPAPAFAAGIDLQNGILLDGAHIVPVSAEDSTRT
jgi:hypothetical protein